MLYVGEKAAKLYKGDYKPAQIYVGEDKVCGWKLVTNVGGNYGVLRTYKTGIDRMTIRGNVYGNGSQTPTNPATITFVDNPTLTVSGTSVIVPQSIKKVLRPDSTSSVIDTITVYNGHVLYNQYIRKYSNFHSVSASAWSSSMGNKVALFYYRTSSTIGAVSDGRSREYGLCSHINKLSNTIYPSSGGGTLNEEYIYFDNNRLYFSLYRQTLIDLYGGYGLNEFERWVNDQNTNGTPVTVWYPWSTPTVTDITNTEAGQALLALHCTPGTTYFAVDKGEIESTVKVLNV